MSGHLQKNTEYRQRPPLRVAFSVNMNQNMHKWAMLSRKYGAEVTLFLNPLEKSAIMAPEWELYDGDYRDIGDGEGFLRKAGDVCLEVPCRKIPMDGSEFINHYEKFLCGERSRFIRLVASPGHPSGNAHLLPVAVSLLRGALPRAVRRGLRDGPHRGSIRQREALLRFRLWR